MIKETPMLFSTAMVNALNNDMKTVTRRIIKNLEIDECSGFAFYKNKYQMDIYRWKELLIEHCPYGQIGDLIWVRESFREMEKGYDFKADYPNRINFRWKPSIHMPKKASRIWLEIIDISIEALQRISDDDALNEGIKDSYEENPCRVPSAHFKDLWISINGADSWEHNPWVWVIKFKKVLRW